MSCSDHDDRHVCERCPEQYETDGWGFAHRSVLKGRTALRHCKGCGLPRPRTEWGSGWYWCQGCEMADLFEKSPVFPEPKP